MTTLRDILDRPDMQLPTGRQVANELQNAMDILERHVAVVHVAEVEAATATANNEPLFSHSHDVQIKRIAFIPEAARSGADTNTRTMVVRNMGDDATGDTDVATFEQTDGEDLAAYVEQELALSEEEGELDLDAGEVLAYRSVKVGDGLITPTGAFVIEYAITGS